MKRSLSILTGTEAGKTISLNSPLFTIGRSSKADLRIEDPLVSRHHLEIKIEGNQVFVEDKSSHGTSLNGNRLRGIVSLAKGDVLELGHVQLRYEELGEPSVEASAALLDDMGPISEGLSGTRFMDRPDDLHGGEDGDPGPEATRGVVSEKTRMLNPSDLPKWKAPTTPKKRSQNRVAVALLVVCGILIVAALYWFVYRPQSELAPGEAMERFSDPVYALSVSYPNAWSRYPSMPDMPLMVGQGQLDRTVWTRMKVEVDRGIPYETMGLTEGFLQYQNSVKTNRSFLGSMPMFMNDLSCIFYGFRLKNGQGKGIFLINGGTRIVVECYSATACYAQQSDLFSTLLRSFSLSEKQQSLDFPMPDDAMQKMALGNPEYLSQLVDEHKRNGDALVANRNVKQDNLYRAIQEYKLALQLSLARPERVKGYQDAAYGLQAAVNYYNLAVRQQRYEINRAMKEGDRETAYWAANKLLQMLPDKTDAIYQETYQLLRRLSLEK